MSTSTWVVDNGIYLYVRLLRSGLTEEVGGTVPMPDGEWHWWRGPRRGRAPTCEAARLQVEASTEVAP